MILNLHTMRRRDLTAAGNRELPSEAVRTFGWPRRPWHRLSYRLHIIHSRKHTIWNDQSQMSDDQQQILVPSKSSNVVEGNKSQPHQLTLVFILYHQAAQIARIPAQHARLKPKRAVELAREPTWSLWYLTILGMGTLLGEEVCKRVGFLSLHLLFESGMCTTRAEEEFAPNPNNHLVIKNPSYMYGSFALSPWMVESLLWLYYSRMKEKVGNSFLGSYSSVRSYWVKPNTQSTPIIREKLGGYVYGRYFTRSLYSLV